MLCKLGSDDKLGKEVHFCEMFLGDLNYSMKSRKFLATKAALTLRLPERYSAVIVISFDMEKCQICLAVPIIFSLCVHSVIFYIAESCRVVYLNM